MDRWRRSIRGMLALLIAPALLGACADGRRELEASSCDMSVSDVPATAQRSTLATAAELTVSPRAGRSVGLVGRDGSAVVVGICLPTQGADLGLPDSDPVLTASGTTVEAFGGSLVSRGSAIQHWTYFPPTPASEIVVTQDSARLATAEFDSSPAPDCRLGAQRPVRVTRCGMLVGLAWQTGLSVDASDVAGMDVGVLGETSAGPGDLGFYYEGASDGEEGLVVHFSIRPPSGPRATLELRSLDLHEAPGDPDRARFFSPPHRQSLRLLGLPGTTVG